MSPSPLGSMCSSYILLSLCSCNAVGWMPERVVVAWFSVIDQRKSSQQNKEHVQTYHLPLPLVRETQTLGSGSLPKSNNDNDSLPTGLQHLCKKYIDLGQADLSIFTAERLEFHLQEGSRPRSLCLHRFIFQFISLPYDQTELLSEMAGHKGIPQAKE